MSEKLFDEKQFVIFELGKESFGLDINKVKEIIVNQKTTHIPGTNDRLEGVINLRGKVIPIFGLCKEYGFPEPEKTRNTRIVVVEALSKTVGLVVDGVSEVLTIQGESVEKPSSMITAGIDTSFLTGIAKIENKLVILLDLEKIITPEVAKAV